MKSLAIPGKLRWALEGRLDDGHQPWAASVHGLRSAHAGPGRAVYLLTAIRSKASGDCWGTEDSCTATLATPRALNQSRIRVAAIPTPEGPRRTASAAQPDDGYSRSRAGITAIDHADYLQRGVIGHGSGTPLLGFDSAAMPDASTTRSPMPRHARRLSRSAKKNSVELADFAGRQFAETVSVLEVHRARSQSNTRSESPSSSKTTTCVFPIRDRLIAKCSLDLCWNARIAPQRRSWSCCRRSGSKDGAVFGARDRSLLRNNGLDGLSNTLNRSAAIQTVMTNYKD